MHFPVILEAYIRLKISNGYKAMFFFILRTPHFTLSPTP